MSSSEEDHWETFLGFPDVDREDLDQEVELARLEGVERPSRWLIYKRLQRQARELLLISDDVIAQEDLAPALVESVALPSLQSTRRLGVWLRKQPETLQLLVWDYLEDPVDEKLEAVLKFLILSGQIQKGQGKPTKRRKSYADMIWDSLPASLEELIEGLDIQAKRPAATVRQTLRRFLEKGLIEKRENKYYKVE